MVTHDELSSYFRGKRVCVVGNAPTVLRERNGARIDEFDVVVRCNSFNTSDAYAPHVGTRTDVVAFSFGLFRGFRAPEIIDALGVRYVVATVPSPEEPTDARSRFFGDDVTRNFLNFRRQGYERHRARTHWLSVEFVDQLGAYVGKRPTTGLSIVAWLLQYGACEELFLTGFSFDNAISSHYNDADYAGALMDYNNHDSRLEGIACQRLVAEAQTRVVLDAHLADVLGRIAQGTAEPKRAPPPLPFEIVEAKLGHGALGLHGTLGFENRLVSIEGERHVRAIAAHAPSSVLLRAQPGLLLELEGALNDTVPLSAPTAVQFTVHGHDGRTLRDLGTAIRGRVTALARVRVPEDGLLELRARTSRKTSAHAVWLWNAPENEGG